MSNISEKQKRIKKERAVERSRRNQAALTKHVGASKQRRLDARKNLRPVVERKPVVAPAPQKAVKESFWSRLRGGGSDRARAREEAQEAAQRELHPHILTKREAARLRATEERKGKIQDVVKEADLEKMPLKELQVLAKFGGLKGYSRLTKPKLIEALRESVR